MNLLKLMTVGCLLSCFSGLMTSTKRILYQVTSEKDWSYHKRRSNKHRKALIPGFPFLNKCTIFHSFQFKVNTYYYLINTYITCKSIVENMGKIETGIILCLFINIPDL
jgi:hypothetical protein